MSATKALTLFALLSFVHGESTCPSGDEACEVAHADLDGDEVSMLAITQAKATKHVQMPTHEPGQSDPEPEEPEGGSNQGVGTTSVGDAPGLLEQSNDALSEVEEHMANVLSKANATMTKQFIRAQLTHARFSYTQQYGDQFFKPRLNLCKDSFTGMASCDLDTCVAMVVIYSTLSNECHPSGWFYSNGDMCRCLTYSATNFYRYHSGSGNNIYKLR